MNVPLASLRLHPDAERVPMASSADLNALRQSLRENGQQDPIDVTSDNVILDGRTRWQLLRDLGAQTATVRIVEMPEPQQRDYIVDRALARRHLSNEQKQALNALLREVVVAVEPNPRTGEEMRIGLNRPQRAAKLGVSTEAVKTWDEGDQGKNTHIPGPDAPTHIRRGGGNPTPYPVRPAARGSKSSESPARVVPKPRRTAPPWQRHFTLWCRAVLPEDRKFLLQMSDELHKALGRLDLACTEKEEIA